MSQKDLYIDIYSGFIHNIRKLKIIQMYSMGKRLVKYY